jgi:hypothetical protein
MLHCAKLAVVVAVLCFSALAFAQGGATGAITGTVQDAAGALISRANVNVINEATGQVVRKVSTDSSGTVSATLLPVGNYSLEVSARGFATSKVTGIVVSITETTRLTAVLKEPLFLLLATTLYEPPSLKTKKFCGGNLADSTTMREPASLEGTMVIFIVPRTMSCITTRGRFRNI